MKKLMIAAAIVCAAAFAQAATINWSFGNINGYGDGGKGWSDTGFAGDASVQLIIGTSLSDGVIGNTIYDASTDVVFEGGYAFPDALTVAAMASDTPYYSQLVITSGSSTLTSGIFEIQASSVDGDQTYPNWALAGEEANLFGQGESSLPGVSAMDSTYGTFSAAGWQSVPEPTSGLLLLIGVAGLALRRRRA